MVNSKKSQKFDFAIKKKFFSISIREWKSQTHGALFPFVDLCRDTHATQLSWTAVIFQQPYREESWSIDRAWDRLALSVENSPPPHTVLLLLLHFIYYVYTHKTILFLMVYKIYNKVKLLLLFNIKIKTFHTDTHTLVNHVDIQNTYLQN